MTIRPDQPLMYAEDLTVGSTIELGEYVITRDDIIDYARRWDPLPMHVDETAAESSYFGRLTASGMHTLAIMHRLAVLGAYQHWHVVAGRETTGLHLRRPVFPDMTLVGELCVDGVHPKRSGHWHVHHSNRLLSDGLVVLEMQQKSVVRARGAG